MKPINTKVTVYRKRYNKTDFLIEIHEMRDKFEAWIGMPDFGIKLFMFGAPKRQRNASADTTHDEFADLVFHPNNFNFYAEDFMEQNDLLWGEQ